MSFDFKIYSTNITNYSALYSFYYEENTTFYDNECEDLQINDEITGPGPKLLLSITILWIFIAAIGILANLCVILVMICGKTLTSATQYFIVNLAVSDLFFLCICPTLALINLHGLINYDHLPDFLAKIICKMNYFFSHVSVFITCLTLMSLTFDRYLVIMHPLKSLSYRTKSKAILINVLIWIISVLLSIPHGYFRILEYSSNNTSFCTNSRDLEDIKINLYFTTISLSLFNLSYTILIAYVIPLVSIVICYLIMMNKLRKEKPFLTDTILRRGENEAKKRRRILMIIAFVTILFGVVWFPIHSFHFAMRTMNCFPFKSSNVYTIKTLCHTLPYINSMLNPFFYTIMGNNFRKQFFAQQLIFSTKLKSIYSRSNKSLLGSKNDLDMNQSLNRKSQSTNRSYSADISVGNNNKRISALFLEAIENNKQRSNSADIYLIKKNVLFKRGSIIKILD